MEGKLIPCRLVLKEIFFFFSNTRKLPFMDSVFITRKENCTLKNAGLQTRKFTAEVL